MAIYGVAILALCTLTGMLLGEVLGWLLQVRANVGGVGIGMLLLIAFTEILRSHKKLAPATEHGILFWSSIYIPIVVAMASSQDVFNAMRSGPLALAAGCLVTIACFTLVPLLDRLGRQNNFAALDDNSDDKPNES